MPTSENEKRDLKSQRYSRRGEGQVFLKWISGLQVLKNLKIILGDFNPKKVSPGDPPFGTKGERIEDFPGNVDNLWTIASRILASFVVSQLKGKGNLRIVEDIPSRRSRSGTPITKCPGVRALTSDRSGEGCVRGLEV
ncbi:hypothetical protein TNIN_389571 [Trichonephila inaurata madagascariensis]|uniref:Uncharacterized protein n=1 Tax=Trichonephila inaurata madagascariensis TaxID=2747483 RepID=A0A8X6X3X1_9ARAC|nr:hypothetical protein TNIN_389571 [Trichonephila inaurata madagascariensis]